LQKLRLVIYCLNSTLSYTVPQGTAIVVASNNVTIDLNGHALLGSGNAVSTTNGIKSRNRKNVTIKNGSIQKFYRGVYLEDTTNNAGGHLVKNIHFKENLFLGAHLEGPSNVVKENRFEDTGGSSDSAWSGGVFFNGINTYITDNNFSGTFTSIGTINTIDIYSSVEASDSVIENNKITGASSFGGSEYGIFINIGTNNVIKNNTISNPDTTGNTAIRAVSTTSSICRENTTINFNIHISTCTDAGDNVAL